MKFFKRASLAIVLILFAAFSANATVASSTSRVKYTCSGGSSYAFTFGVDASSEIKVVKTVTSTGVETVMVETTDYTVAATNNDYTAGGTVNTTVACATGNTLTILRNVPITQGNDFTEGMPTLYETFEDSLDKITRIHQQQQEELNRSLKNPIPSTAAVPTPVSDNYIGWNAAGTALENKILPALVSATGSDTAFYSSASCPDQGAAGTGCIASLLTSIGTSKQATIVLAHSGSGNTTTYTVTTPISFSSYPNITLVVENGAVIAGSITGLKEARPEWWGGWGDDSTDCTSALNTASLAVSTTGTVMLSDGIYRVTATAGNYAVTFYGAVKGRSPNTTKIKNVGAGSAVVFKGTSDVTGDFYYVRVSGFSVVGNASSEDGITLNPDENLNRAVSYSYFEDVESVEHGRHGLVHKVSWATKYTNCKFMYNGGLGVYLDPSGSYHNNIIFTNCDSRWNGGTGNSGADFLKGGVRLSGNGVGVYWNGGIVESNNAWGFIIGHDTSSSYLDIIKIQNVFMEDTPKSTASSTTGGLFHADEKYSRVEVSNSYLAYYAPAGGTGYAFYINHVPEVGTSFKEWGNQVESSGTGTATRDYNLTYDWTRPLVSNTMNAPGDWGILQASATGQWAIKGFIHLKKTTDNTGGVYPFVAGRDAAASAGALQVAVGASLVGAATTPPTMSWIATANTLAVNLADAHYGHVEMTLGTSDDPPTTFTIPSTATRNKTVNGDFDWGDGYVFTVTAANATVGATYTNNGQTFTVKQTISGTTTLYCSGTGAPLANGTLTRASGTGDATISYSAYALSWTKDAGWTIVDQGGGNYEAVGTNVASGNRIYQAPGNITIGKTYRVDIVCSNFTDGTVAAYAYGGVMGTKIGTAIGSTITSSLVFVAQEISILIGAISQTAASDFRVGSIALYEVATFPNDLVKRSNP